MVILKQYDFKKMQFNQIDVGSGIFDIEVRNDIIHHVVDAYLTNRRAGTACTKGRSEVSGSGRKPWKQKGTGRARSGSVQSPLWRGGAVAFGPKPRDFFKKVNKKVKRLAIKMVMAAKKEDLLILHDFYLDKPKTKDVYQMLKSASITNSLIVLNDVSANIEMATSNIQGIKVIKLSEMNVYEVLLYKQLCIDDEAIAVMQKEFVA